MKQKHLFSFAVMVGLFAPSLLALSALVLLRPEQGEQHQLFFLTMLYPVVLASGIFLARAVGCRSWQPLLEAVRGLFVAFLCGLMLGVGLRLMMRLVAVAAGREPEFTIGGTAMILLVGAFLGGDFGLLFVAVRQRLPSKGLGRGLAFGAVLYVMFWPPFFLAANEDLNMTLHPLIIVLATSVLSALWLVYGVTVEAAAGIVLAQDKPKVVKEIVGGDHRRADEKKAWI